MIIKNKLPTAAQLFRSLVQQNVKHIFGIPGSAWAECETDALRHDLHNGLLLSALSDAAFDSGLVSFADDGTALALSSLGSSAFEVLGMRSVQPLTGLTDSHFANLARHRT